MAFADPQSINIGAGAVSLPRVETGKNESAYLSADGSLRLSASTAYGRRIRRVLRIDHTKVAADPFIPAQNVKLGMSNYLVFDTPVAGYTAAEALAVYGGFKTLFTASSDLLITKLLGGES